VPNALKTSRFRGGSIASGWWLAPAHPGFLVIALILLIWHTGVTFRSRDKADSFADRGFGETLNKHKGLS
jgi:hypothetical protein